MGTFTLLRDMQQQNMFLKAPAQCKGKKKYVLFSKIALLTNNDLNIGKAVLYSKSLKQRALLLTPLTMCDLCITSTLSSLVYTLEMTLHIC